MKFYIFVDKLLPELSEKSASLKLALPESLNAIKRHPAEIVESRVDAILALIGILQKFKCHPDIYNGDGVCLNSDFF